MRNLVFWILGLTAIGFCANRGQAERDPSTWWTSCQYLPTGCKCSSALFHGLSIICFKASLGQFGGFPAFIPEGTTSLSFINATFDNGHRKNDDRIEINAGNFAHPSFQNLRSLTFDRTDISALASDIVVPLVKLDHLYLIFNPSFDRLNANFEGIFRCARFWSFQTNTLVCDKSVFWLVRLLNKTAALGKGRSNMRGDPHSVKCGSPENVRNMRLLEYGDRFLDKIDKQDQAVLSCSQFRKKMRKHVLETVTATIQTKPATELTATLVLSLAMSKINSTSVKSSSNVPNNRLKNGEYYNKYHTIQNRDKHPSTYIEKSSESISAESQVPTEELNEAETRAFCYLWIQIALLAIFIIVTLVISKFIKDHVCRCAN